MNAITGAARYVGQRVPRKEDKRLLLGRGQYVDDVTLPGMFEAAFVRSPYARAAIRSVDVSAARAFPGVRAVYVAADLEPLGARCELMYSSGVPTTEMHLLATDRVRHVGEPVAIVIADNRYIAEDAAELVEVDYEMQDAVVTIADARAGGAPVHPEFDTNIAHETGIPDPTIDDVFASAAHVVEHHISHQRQAHVPMETRGVVASREGADELLVYLSCQSPHLAATYISNTFHMGRSNVRVISKDVGGAFGLKVQLWREEVAVIAAALVLGRPVKWIEDRIENLTSACQAREQEILCRMAFDADAKLLAADYLYECNLGSFAQGIDANSLAMMMVQGPYKLPRLRYRAVAYYSNTPGQAAYRGPWAAESLMRETTFDMAARQIGIAPDELRRRNLITAADQPFPMMTGPVLERVTPYECLEKVLEKLDLGAFRAEQAEARKQGRYLGLGLAVYVEPTTMGMVGQLSTENAHIRMDPGGRVIASLGTHSQGHGTATTMAQVIADELGVDYDRVTVLEDDSSRGAYGGGAGGSRQAVAGGGAAKTASALLAAKIKTIAGHMFNANPDHVTISGGMVRISEDVSEPIERIALAAYHESERLPQGMEPGLEVSHRYKAPPMVFSNAAHACVVEVDAETGLVKILRWIAGEDCGVMINPSIVEGQIAGGLAQAIGGILFEHIHYDAMGNPTSATFKDYLVPSCADVPTFEYCHLVTPSDTPGGHKGVGEGGAIIGPPALANAVADALAPFGKLELTLPLSPDRLVAFMDAAA
jgi:carbon-monoxide dehydrogenase large subunit